MWKWPLCSALTGEEVLDVTPVCLAHSSLPLPLPRRSAQRLLCCRARNAAGLVDPNYWTGTLQPRPTVDWYLQRISTAVDAAKAVAPGASITLLAHSAGGWLGRLFMLDWGTEGIDQFVSLGSPHLPPPEGVIDQTRGILTFVSQACPGVHHPDVQYITIAGRYIRGAPLLGPGSWAQRVVGAGYQQVCGDAQVWGDGVVPVPAAHLEGALQLTLDGVYHSPLGAVDEPAAVDAAAQKGSYISDSDDFEVTQRNVEAAAQEARPGPRVWYGSPHVLEAWAGVLTNPQAARELVAAAASTAAERM